MDAQTSMRVPLIVKCSRANRLLHSVWAETRERNSAATSEPINLSLFLVKTGVVPDIPFQTRAEKPSEQEVAMDLFHQLPVTADG
ncbi:hypothetical protein RW64_00075 [Geobacter sulfurreducens]|nr:hypothetical protein RW64_00075 [Geobacter sulfurreducens]